MTATSATLPPAPVPGPILETSLYVDDLDSAEAFYGDLLGLTCILHEAGRHRFYRLGPATVLLVFLPEGTERPSHGPLPVPVHGARGPGHLCFAMPDAAITALAARLTAAGVPTEADFRWPNGARSLYVRDPAGNSIEFAEPALWA